MGLIAKGLGSREEMRIEDRQQESKSKHRQWLTIGNIKWVSMFIWNFRNM